MREAQKQTPLLQSKDVSSTDFYFSENVPPTAAARVFQTIWHAVTQRFATPGGSKRSRLDTRRQLLASYQAIVWLLWPIVLWGVITSGGYGIGIRLLETIAGPVALYKVQLGDYGIIRSLCAFLSLFCSMAGSGGMLHDLGPVAQYSKASLTTSLWRGDCAQLLSLSKMLAIKYQSTCKE
jgi:nitrate reductase NapE component